MILSTSYFYIFNLFPMLPQTNTSLTLGIPLIALPLLKTFAIVPDKIRTNSQLTQIQWLTHDLIYPLPS